MARANNIKFGTIVCIFVEVTIILSVAVLSVSMRLFLTPNKRGFFLDDQSISHPFSPSTVPNHMLYLIGFLVPVATMFVLEGFYIRCHMDQHRIHRFLPESPTRRTQWIWRCYQILAIFVFGAAATHFLTNLPKYSVGRLRPHFLEVCKPNRTFIIESGLTNHSYITQDVCTGDNETIKEARLSFPSGHSSMSMYCALIFILYLQKRFTWAGIFLLRPLLQTVIFGLGLFTALSRVSDYKHHWDDVLVGSLLGCLLAVLTIYRMSEVVFKRRNHCTNETNGAASSHSLAAYRSRSAPLTTVIMGSSV